MTSLCGRPGCSEPGTVAYGMVPTDLVFWIAPLESSPPADARVLCQRHADAMVVPRGWTLDDRRENALRLFSTHQRSVGAAPRPRRRTRPASDAAEQLQIDGTGEIERPVAAEPAPEPEPAVDESVQEWQPEFDTDDDLDGLLEVTSPLLARAFRGTDRPRR